MAALPKLAEIQADISDILAEWENPELTPERLQELEAQLEYLINTQTVKIDNIAAYFRLQTAIADACKEEAKRLQGKARAIEARLDWLRYHYLLTMKQHGISKIKGEAYSMSIRKSEAVDITDITELMDAAPQYVVEKIDWQPNKTAIKEAIKAGREVPGARIVERESLQIR